MTNTEYFKIVQYYLLIIFWEIDLKYSSNVESLVDNAVYKSWAEFCPSVDGDQFGMEYKIPLVKCLLFCVWEYTIWLGFSKASHV